MADLGSGRAYALTLLLGLGSAAAVAVGTTRPWAYAASSAQPGFPTQQATASGADLAPLAAALGVVLLAAFGAVIATRGLVRRGLGVLVVVASAAVAAETVLPGDPRPVLAAGLRAKGWYRGSIDAQVEGWRWLVLVGAVGCLVAGLLVVGYGGRWATMGRRYDAPTASPALASSPDGARAAVQATEGSTSEETATTLTDAELWQAIDDGHDPTQRP